MTMIDAEKESLGPDSIGTNTAAATSSDQAGLPGDPHDRQAGDGRGDAYG